MGIDGYILGAIAHIFDFFMYPIGTVFSIRTRSLAYQYFCNYAQLLPSAAARW